MFEKKEKTSAPQEQLDAKGEFERLTDELIQETIAPGGEMMQQLERMIKDYSASENPLSIQDAKNILFSVLLTAVRQRRRLSGRIANSVETGMLFNQYYGKIQDINHYTVSANEKLERMRLARRQYEYQQQIYWGVVGRTYDQAVRKESEKTETGDVMPSKIDTWKELDEEGGLENEEATEDEVDE